MSSQIEQILTALELDRPAAKYGQLLKSFTEKDVERELSQKAGHFNLERLAILISPAAKAYLEKMAQIASQLTIQRFGRVIQLYAPLYVSNYCVNGCVYCGYNCKHHFDRTRLTIEEALKDAQVIALEGFRNILLVSGEDRKFISVDYLAELARRLRNNFSSISLEIYQVTRDEYQKLFDAGIDGMTLYQETYDRELYKQLHKGPKADYSRRLFAHDDAALAQMRRLGLGALLGLSDWRFETLALGVHASYLMKKYWRSHIAFSFPRMRPAHDVKIDLKLPGDSDLVQMMLALRLCFADATLYLSTRESAVFRDNLIGLGINCISAGSKTNPGGYTGHDESIGQFDVNDSRTPSQVAQMIAAKGFEPVWKDWDAAFSAAK